MKKIYLPLFAFLLFSCFSLAQRLSNLPQITPAGKGIVVPYADNIGYWQDMVRQGYVKPEKIIPWTAPKKLSSSIHTAGLPPQDSQDVPVSVLTTITQSENSVFIDPGDEDQVLNSNNSSDWFNGFVQNPIGADAYHSQNAGLSWGGTFQGAGGPNRGDPATAIGRDGRWYVGMISNTYGMSVAYSTNKGSSWTEVEVAPGPTSVFGLLDKNHLAIDNSLSSPFQGNLYVAWTNFITGTADTNQIQVSRSLNGGEHWFSPTTLSRGVNAGKLNHGVNIATGPLGQVYMAWSIYDTWPSDETSIGFTRSLDGGSVWQNSHRIITNIKGIRNSMTGKAMRVNSFPSMAVDLSSGPYRGTLYLVWANVGFPGVNTGSDIDVYLIKSLDNGDTWSTPLKVNQDPSGLGKQHYFPWITVDPVTGAICVIYYDDRNVSATEAETWVSYSYDGGNSFTDFRVSDVSFTPSPIPGLAYNYFGDYLGISAMNLKVYPMWTDNRLEGGQTMTWTSPFTLSPAPGQPWVNYFSNELTTVSSGTPTTLKYRDSLHLTLAVKNIGDLNANNLQVKVTSPSPYITMTDSLEPYPSIAPDATGSVTNGFAFKVSDTIPDNIMVRFNIKVSNPDTSWNSHFSVESHAPGLRIIGMSIHDQNGNNNGRFDPGETDDVTITIMNPGDFACPSTYGKLSTASQYLSLLNDSVFADTLKPFSFAILHYTVTVSDSAPTSAGADMDFTVRSGLYSKNTRFHEIIGLVAEDWESNSFAKFPWHFGGNTSWNLTNVNPYEGSFCAVSGQIEDQQSSQLYVTYTSAANDSISFYLKTSTELDYDYLNFFIDNTLEWSWSGDNPWTRAAFPVSAGTHTFKWIYQKDLASAGGTDQVGLDFIVFPAPIVPDVTIGPNDSICAGASYTLQASAQQYDSLRWVSSGDGSFSNPTLLEPIYTPGSNDIILGTVKLKLFAYSGYGRSIRSMILSIKGLPVAEITVFPKDSVCAWQTITVSADTTGVNSYLWTPGNLSTQTALIDTAIAGGIGTRLFRLRTMNKAGCSKTDSVYLTFKNCLGISEEEAGFRLNIYPNPSQGIFTLELISDQRETVALMLEDLSQKIIFEEKNVMVIGRTIKSLNFASLPSGMYMLKIIRKDAVLSRKLIISR